MTWNQLTKKTPWLYEHPDHVINGIAHPCKQGTIDELTNSFTGCELCDTELVDVFEIEESNWYPDEIDYANAMETDERD